MEPNSEEGLSLVEKILSDEHISHHGVKGMKWGVRKNRKGKIRARTTMTRASRRESDWLNLRILQGGSYAEAYNKTFRRAQGKIRKNLRALNRNVKYKKEDFRTNSALRREYYDAASKIFTDQLNASATRHGVSPSGKLEMHFNFDVSKSVQPTISVRLREHRRGRKQTRVEVRKKVQHEDSLNYIDVELVIITDDDGMIIDFELPKIGDNMIHSVLEDSSDIYLSHYGVKGMRWGVRKDRRTGATKNTKATVTKTPKAPKKPEPKPVKSGKATVREPASNRKFADLSDEQLRSIINRIELEQRLDKLTTPQAVKNGKGWVKKSLETAGSQLLTQAVVTAGNFAMSQALNKMSSGALKNVEIKKK